MRRIWKVITSRLLIIAPLVIAQFVVFAGFLYNVAILAELQPFFSLFAVLTSIYVINRPEDPAYKIAWLLVILGAPVIGIPLYIMAGNRHVPKKLYNGTTEASQEMVGILSHRNDLDTSDEPEDIKQIFNYAYKTSGFPVYRNTESKYYKSGEEWFPDYLEALRNAKKFIFMEFFIINDGSCWQEILAILKQKAQEGVGVKLIYDDFGSITLPYDYDLQLRRCGIEAYRFNKVRAAFIIQMNNRDHRKITVIDNEVAFTGGVNLSDEYINRERRFGVWKDSAIRIKGYAVWSFSVMFLGMFTYCRGPKYPMDYMKYKLPTEPTSDGGYYQPYSDTPTDSKPVALNMHLNIVNSARKYVYIDTPYLILNETMIQALCRAAQSAIDVRILVPHIPDKKTVFQITRGSYERLMKNGVRIYEYTPGFNHAKNFVSDDRLAIVGTANTDYRSYFLHFENGLLMYKTKEVLRIRDDFLNSLAKSHEVTLEELNKEFFIVRIVRAILNVLIPLV